MSKRIAITPGEPAGIGPDLVITIAQQAWDVELVVVASKKLFNRTRKPVKFTLNFN